MIVSNQDEEEEDIANPHDRSLNESVDDEVNRVVVSMLPEDVGLKLIFESLIALNVLIWDCLVNADCNEEKQDWDELRKEYKVLSLVDVPWVNSNEFPELSCFLWRLASMIHIDSVNVRTQVYKLNKHQEFLNVPSCELRIEKTEHEIEVEDKVVKLDLWSDMEH
jgi:hypothetical protein